MDFTSVIPGKIGEMKQVVLIPALWNVFIAARRLSMLTALSISFLNDSSRVFIDHETLASGKVF